MAEVYDLKANVRTSFGKGAARKLRVTNHIPAVVYGHGGETQHVALPAHELTLLVRHMGEVSEAFGYTDVELMRETASLRVQVTEARLCMTDAILAGINRASISVADRWMNFLYAEWDNVENAEVYHQWIDEMDMASLIWMHFTRPVTDL